MWYLVRLRHHRKSTKVHLQGRVAWGGIEGKEGIRREKHRKVSKRYWMHRSSNKRKESCQILDRRACAKFRIRGWQHCWSCSNQKHDDWANIWFKGGTERNHTTDQQDRQWSSYRIWWAWAFKSLAYHWRNHQNSRSSEANHKHLIRGRWVPLPQRRNHREYRRVAKREEHVAYR